MQAFILYEYDIMWIELTWQIKFVDELKIQEL